MRLFENYFLINLFFRLIILFSTFGELILRILYLINSDILVIIVYFFIVHIELIIINIFFQKIFGV